MAESEHDELKEAIEWMKSFQVSIDPIVVQWSAALLDALEDCERLRAALAESIEQTAYWQRAFVELENKAALKARDGV